MEVFRNFLPSELRESYGRGGRKGVRARGDGEQQENKALESTRHGAYECPDTKRASTGPTRVCTRSLVSIL